MYKIILSGNNIDKIIKGEIYMKKILIIVLGLMLILGGCVKQPELKEEFNTDEFYTKGYDLLGKVVMNLELKEYKVDLNKGWLAKYREYELDDTQQTYYDLILQTVQLNNKFKETNEKKYLEELFKKQEDLIIFFKNNKKTD